MPESKTMNHHNRGSNVLHVMCKNLNVFAPIQTAQTVEIGGLFLLQPHKNKITLIIRRKNQNQNTLVIPKEIRGIFSDKT